MSSGKEEPKVKILSLKRLSIRKVGSFVKSIENHIQMENEQSDFSFYSQKQDSTTRRRWRVLSWLCSSPKASIPLSMMYAMLIYLYIVYIVAPANDGNKEIGFRSSHDFKFAFSCHGKSNFGNESTLLKNDSQSMVNETLNQIKRSTFGQHQIIGVCLSAILGTFFVLCGLKSRYIRCVSVLILPGLLAGRGRTILMTVAMSLLLEGPINSINYNLNQVVESQVCMYESVKQSGCYFNNQIEAILKKSNVLLRQQRDQLDEELARVTGEMQKQIGRVEKELVDRQKELEKKIQTFQKEFSAIRKIFEGLNKPCGFVNSALADVTDFFNDIGDWFSFKRKRRATEVCKTSIPLPDIDWDSALKSSSSLEELEEWLKDLVPKQRLPFVPSLPNIKGLLETSSVEKIRQKIMSMISNVFKSITNYVVVIKRCSLVISMVLLVGLAYHYLRQYLSDDAFDNHYIDENIKRLWRLWPDTWQKLTPLRHWELDERYQISASLRLSKIEWKRVLIKVLPTLSFSVVVVSLILVDYGLSEFLSNLAANGKFAVSFANVVGNGKDGSFDSKRVYKVDLLTEPCLPRPTVTRRLNIAFLLLITLSIALTCIFDAYLSRVRSCICNQFYPEQGKDRAQYLYSQLKFGRNARKIRIRSIISREVKKREHLQALTLIPRQTLLKLKIKMKQFRCKNDVKPSGDDCDADRTSPSVAVCCPGCHWKVPRKDTKSISIDIQNRESIVVDICTDCAKDL